MKFPLMTRARHERALKWESDYHDAALKTYRDLNTAVQVDLVNEFQQLVDAEYARALAQGRSQIHRLAVDMTYDLFVNGMNALTPPKLRALLQDVEHMFKPEKTILTTKIEDHDE